MTKLSLNIGERIFLSNVINQFGVGLSLSGMKMGMDVLDKILLSKEEIKKVGYKVYDNNKIKWDDQKYEKEVELDDDKIKFCKEMLKKKDEAKAFAVNEGGIMNSLTDKIGGLK